MIRALAIAGFVVLPIAFAAASAGAQQGCCACTGLGAEQRSICLEDVVDCANLEGGCINEGGGTFMPFTPGSVCRGQVGFLKCVPLSLAPALSQRLLAVMAVALALLGYCAARRRRAVR